MRFCSGVGWRFVKEGVRLRFFIMEEWGEYFLKRVGRDFTWSGKVRILRGDWVEIFYSGVEIFQGTTFSQGSGYFSGEHN